MRVVVTGITSFSGMCIAEAFSQGGHTVTGLAQGLISAYGGRKRVRLERASRAGVALQGELGAESGALAAWARTAPIDVWVHHHHPMNGFRGQDYDVVSASRAAIEPLPELLHSLQQTKVKLIVQSGTYFEPGEGGQAQDAPVTPYSELKARVSKELTQLAGEYGIRSAKIVIPSPSGTLENEDRLTPQLLLAGLRGETFVVGSPDSVFDSIPGEALAEIYVRAAEGAQSLPDQATVLRPSGWIVSAGDWSAWIHEQILKPLGGRGELILNTTNPLLKSHFQNPETEKVPVDWARFAADYLKEWNQNYPFL